MVESNTNNLEQVLEEIAVYLKTSPDALQIETIRHGTRKRQNVWRLRIGTEYYVIKQHYTTFHVSKGGSYTPFQIESTVLSMLHRCGCNVPKVVWKSESFQTLLLEGCGELTLDAIAQRHGNLSTLSIDNKGGGYTEPTLDTKKRRQKPTTTSEPASHRILHAAIQELGRIENCFAEQTRQLKPYVFRFNSHETLRRLLEQGKKTVGYLTQARGISMSTAQIERLETAWKKLSDRLLNAPTTLGSLDYNARNIVINSGKPVFIDFASIGWDWQERRLIQMFNSIGAFMEKSNFVSLLNRKLVKRYVESVIRHAANGGQYTSADSDDIAARVDAHHLLFYLSVIHRLLEAMAQPEKLESQLLLNAWGEPQVRFQRALTLIVNTRLSQDADTNQIRDIIAG